jgi:hypothetical protein
MLLCLKIALATTLYVFIILAVASLTSFIPSYQVGAVIGYPVIAGFALATVVGLKEIVDIWTKKENKYEE